MRFVYFFGLIIVIMIVLSACQTFSVDMCIDDGVCTQDERVFGTCSDCVVQNPSTLTYPNSSTPSQNNTSVPPDIFIPPQINRCTDRNACNYQLNQTCDYSCLGCTNSIAKNYNENASVDDGSCIIDCSIYGTCILRGCTHPSATNYDTQAIEDDGSCSFADPDPEPTYDCTTDGTCPVYDDCTYYGTCPTNDRYGCTDSSASNYNSDANYDDGSCYYDSTESACWDSSACNYGSTGDCDYSCQSTSTDYCMDTSACNYGTSDSCDYSCYS
jgi:hypothetical protein